MFGIGVIEFFAICQLRGIDGTYWEEEEIDGIE